MRRASRAAVLLLATLVGDLVPAGDAIVSGRFTSGGVKRTYAAYAPPSEIPRPLVILLHGSGWSGRAMVQRWRGLAKREGFVVAGPDATDRNRWQPPQESPTLLRDLVEALKPHHIDTRRVYLFGYSAGAVFALQSVFLATVKRLERAGFPVKTSLVPGGRHNYQFSGEINERAWKFLQQHRLATDPVFVPVQFTPALDKGARRFE